MAAESDTDSDECWVSQVEETRDECCVSQVEETRVAFPFPAWSDECVNP